MTGKERINCAMEGQPSDVVPWVPNINQWFYANQFNGTLPDDLCDCRTPIEAVQWLGGEIVTRWDGQIKGRGFPGNPRFIYSSSCNTSPRTPWPIILALRDAGVWLRQTSEVRPVR